MSCGDPCEFSTFECNSNTLTVHSEFRFFKLIGEGGGGGVKYYVR